MACWPPVMSSTKYEYSYSTRTSIDTSTVIWYLYKYGTVLCSNLQTHAQKVPYVLYWNTQKVLIRYVYGALIHPGTDTGDIVWS